MSWILRAILSGGTTQAHMYMPYLMYGYAATAALLLLGCRVCSETMPGLKGIKLLSWALGCGLLSVILLALRPYAPAWISILLANEALFTCVLLFYCAAAEMLAVPMRFLPWGVGIAAIALTGNAYFTYIHSALTVRILIGSGTCAVYSAATAMLFRRYDADQEQFQVATSLRSLTAALASLQVLAVVLHVVRCVLTVLYPPSDILHIDMIQAAFTYANMLVGVATGCGLLWLAVCEHRGELEMLARTDGLTGLLNRRSLDEILDREMRRLSRGGTSIALLMLDIDHFKEINDSLGHYAGDEVIRRISTALRDGMRPGDTLARYGGEEFVMLLRNVTEAQAEGIAGRLRIDIAGLNNLPGGVSVTVSVGVTASRAEDTSKHILRRCDDALYRSKRAGRNRVTVNRLNPIHSPASLAVTQEQP